LSCISFSKRQTKIKTGNKGGTGKGIIQACHSTTGPIKEESPHNVRILKYIVIYYLYEVTRPVKTLLQLEQIVELIFLENVVLTNLQYYTKQ
jgi:hypothetical protein